MTIDEIYNLVKKEFGIKSYKIEKKKSDDLTIFDSKFGGIPYWDFSKEYPTDSNKEKLKLLAQINFDNEKINDDRLPKTGILQFYISTNDDVYGMNFDNQDEQTNWRVVYHEKVDYDTNEEEIKNNGIKSLNEANYEDYVPFNESYKITFKEINEVMSSSDEKFDILIARILKDKLNIEIDEANISDYLEQIDEKYYKKFDTCGHKLLGYPAFAQYDPRYKKRYKKYDTLLLQIATDDEIMWGDTGIANFFINKEDLENKNFNDILYNWDCY